MEPQKKEDFRAKGCEVDRRPAATLGYCELVEKGTCKCRAMFFFLCMYVCDTDYREMKEEEEDKRRSYVMKLTWKAWPSHSHSFFSPCLSLSQFSPSVVLFFSLVPIFYFINLYYSILNIRPS